jgi:hypothetical protein
LTNLGADACAWWRAKIVLVGGRAIVLIREALKRNGFDVRYARCAPSQRQAEVVDVSRYAITKEQPVNRPNQNGTTGGPVPKTGFTRKEIGALRIYAVIVAAIAAGLFVVAPKGVGQVLGLIFCLILLPIPPAVIYFMRKRKAPR